MSHRQGNAFETVERLHTEISLEYRRKRIEELEGELAVKTGLIDDMETFLEKIGHLEDWLEYQQADQGE